MKTISGYEIAITAFVRADPADPASMARAMKNLDGITRSDFDELYRDDEVQIAISPPRWIARRKITRGPDAAEPPSADGAPHADGKGQDDPSASPQDARAGQGAGTQDDGQDDGGHTAAPSPAPAAPASPPADPLDLPPGLDRRVAPRIEP